MPNRTNADSNQRKQEGRPFEMAIKIAFVLPVCAIGGAASGLLVYATRRLSEARKPQ